MFLSLSFYSLYCLLRYVTGYGQFSGIVSGKVEPDPGGLDPVVLICEISVAEVAAREVGQPRQPHSQVESNYCHSHSQFSKFQSDKIDFDAVAPQVRRYLSVVRGANARVGEAFGLFGHTLLQGLWRFEPYKGIFTSRQAFFFEPYIGHFTIHLEIRTLRRPWFRDSRPPLWVRCASDV